MSPASGKGIHLKECKNPTAKYKSEILGKYPNDKERLGQIETDMDS